MGTSRAKNDQDQSGPQVDASLLTVARPELLKDGSDLAFREMIHELLVLAHQLGRIRDGFARVIGVSAIQYEILLILRGSVEAGLGVSDLARRLHRSLPFTTIEIGRLSERNLVDKKPDPVDRRRVIVSLTNAGLDLLKEVAPFQQQTNDVLFASLRPSDFERLRKLLPLVNDDAERAVDLLRFLAGGKKGG